MPQDATVVNPAHSHDVDREDEQDGNPLLPYFVGHRRVRPKEAGATVAPASQHAEDESNDRHQYSDCYSEIHKDPEAQAKVHHPLQRKSCIIK